MNNLEDKCLDLVEQFDPDELVALAAQNQQSVHLMQTIFSHLSRRPSP